MVTLDALIGVVLIPVYDMATLSAPASVPSSLRSVCLTRAERRMTFSEPVHSEDEDAADWNRRRSNPMKPGT
jgi:hypothetical protein